MLIVYQPLIDCDNNVDGLYGMAHDLSEQANGDNLHILSSQGYAGLFLNIASVTRTEFQHPLLKRLTNKEIICLKYLLLGRQAKNIGLILNCSVRTIEKHIENIKEKFNVNTKTRLIEFCIENALFDVLTII